MNMWNILSRYVGDGTTNAVTNPKGFGGFGSLPSELLRSSDPVLLDYIGRLRTIDYFGGGSRKEWEKVLDWVGCWERFFPDQDFGRVHRVRNEKELANLIGNPLLITDTYRLLYRNPGRVKIGYIHGSARSLLDRASSTITEAVFDFWKEGTVGTSPAMVEVEILRLGGFLVGQQKLAGEEQSLLVYFPFNADILMDKIMGEHKKGVSTTVSGDLSSLNPRTLI